MYQERIMEEIRAKTLTANGVPEKKRHAPSREAAFDRPRDFLNNRFSIRSYRRARAVCHWA
jgi:hypothetical protein